jgi:hypothetical protein
VHADDRPGKQVDAVQGAAEWVALVIEAPRRDADGDHHRT